MRGLNVLLGRLGVEGALKTYGMKEDDVDKAVEIVVAKPYPNPRVVMSGEIREGVGGRSRVRSCDRRLLFRVIGGLGWLGLLS